MFDYAEIYDWYDIDVPRKYWGVPLGYHQNNAIETLREFCTNNTAGVFILQGGNGTGKTETACASITERVLKGFPAGLYISNQYMLCPMFRSTRLSNSNISEWEWRKKYYETPYLVIDEVGKGDDANLEKSLMTSFLSARYANGTKTLICTNWTVEEFKDWLGADIKSRLSESITILSLDGDDNRKNGNHNSTTLPIGHISPKTYFKHCPLCREALSEQGTCKNPNCEAYLCL